MAEEYFSKGDAVAVLSFKMGRSDGLAWEGIFATDISSWDAEKAPEGAKEVIDKITNRVHNQADWLELGPAPGLPFFVPAGACDGVTFPKLAKVGEPTYNQWGDMTREMWANLPYTFIRKTLRGMDLEVAFSNKFTVPFQSFNPKNLKEPLQLQGRNIDAAYPGYSAIVYNLPAKGGLTRSGWQFFVDGVLRTAWIEHRELNTDGTEKDTLTELWKPKDIFEKIILPRINKNMPLKLFGWNFAITAELELVDGGLIHTGWIYKPRHIAAAQCQLMLDPSWLDPLNYRETFPIITWETAFAAWKGIILPSYPVSGMVFNHYFSPAYCLPFFTAMISDLIQNPALLPDFLYFVFGTGDPEHPLTLQGNMFRTDSKDPVGILEVMNLFSPVLEILIRQTS